jgi:hypothetical protein
VPADEKTEDNEPIIHGGCKHFSKYRTKGKRQKKNRSRLQHSTALYLQFQISPSNEQPHGMEDNDVQQETKTDQKHHSTRRTTIQPDEQFNKMPNHST